MDQDKKIVNFHHVTFWVGNAQQAAAYYCTSLGFKPFAYADLTTGSRSISKHAIKQNEIIFVFQSCLQPEINHQLNQHISKHGDGVQDVAFKVENVASVVEHARKQGAEIVEDIHNEQDEYGSIKKARIKTFGDVTHTLIDCSEYNGIFLPGYKQVNHENPLFTSLPEVSLLNIDHFVGCQPTNCIETVGDWYIKTLQFHRFWSVDDDLIAGNETGLKIFVISNENELVKVPLVEPFTKPKTEKKEVVSQVQEYLNYNNGPGIQHVAMYTENIVKTVEAMRCRGMEFLQIPDTYYEILKEKLKNCKVKVKEDVQRLQKNQILIDYDENGYLLQIFTKMMQDRPTFFLEIIQRNNHNGFGAGNIKALFEAVEKCQKERGNLYCEK